MGWRLLGGPQAREAEMAAHGWRELNQGLARTPNAETTERLWFEGVVGCRVDYAPGALPRGASGAAMFLWDHVRSLLHDPESNLEDGWNEMVRVDRNGQRPLLELVRRDDVGRLPDQEPMDTVALRLWQGNFAAARFAVALALESGEAFVRHAGRFQPGKSLRRDFWGAVSAYYAFWRGEDLSAEQHRQGLRTLAALPSSGREQLSNLAEQFGAAWVEAEWALAELLANRDSRRIAFAMLRRVVDWLRTPRCRDPESLRTWILLAQVGGGNCARLVLTPVPQGLHEPLAFPDPIRLGLLPVDRDWRTAFDAAARAITSCCNPAERLARVAWSLEFVSPQVVRRLCQSRPGLTGSLARPCFIRGPSASAAFAALWAVAVRGGSPRGDVVVAAEVLADGKLRSVGAMPEKLDGALWQSFVGTFVRQLIVCPEESSDLRNWIGSIAGRAGDGRPEFLQEAASLSAVVDRLAASPRRVLPRRVWLTTALLGLGAGAVASAPAVRRTLFPAPLGDHEFHLRVFVKRKGTSAALPLGVAEPPFVPGDGVRLELAADRPSYFYLFWVDALGKAAPLWPWKGQDWRSRSADRDRPLTHVSLPEPRPDNSAPLLRLLPDAPGLQTILAVARRTPLPATVDVQRLLGGIPAQHSTSPWRADAALDIASDGIARLTAEAGSNRVLRTPIGEELYEESADDPLPHLQRLVRSRLDGAGEVAAALSFAFESPTASLPEHGAP